MNTARKKQIIALGRIYAQQVKNNIVGYSDSRIFLRELTCTGLISYAERNYLIGTILKNNPSQTLCRGNYYLPHLRIYNK